MKKLDLLEKVSEKSKVESSKANRVIKSLIKTIRESLKNGERVTLSGLGTFRIKVRKAKPARNLQTGERIYLPEGKKISFKPTLSFRRCLTSKDLVTPTTPSHQKDEQNFLK